MEFKKITAITAMGLILIIALTIGTVTTPYRYESGFKLYQSWIDLNGQGIYNGTMQFMTAVTNISTNYTVSEFDDTVLVDSTKGSVNISIPLQNTSGKVFTFKKVDASPGNMTVQAAALFMGNESNATFPNSTWQNQPGFNETYFYSINVTKPFTLTSISIHLSNQSEGAFNASIYNSSGGKPSVQLDSTANTSVVTVTDGAGLWTTAKFNGTALNVNRYWIGLQLNKTSVYVANATYMGVSIFNYTNNDTMGIMPHRANVTLLNQSGINRLLVPNFALNLQEIEGRNIKGTTSQYATFRIQYDGLKWWVI